MIKEGKNAVKWTKLSCHDFVDNEVRLQLFALAYNLGNFFRQVTLPKSVRHWTMTTLREKVIKIGVKVVSHARYTIFQLAEVAVSKDLFAAILGRIQGIRRLLGLTRAAGYLGNISLYNAYVENASPILIVFLCWYEYAE